MLKELQLKWADLFSNRSRFRPPLFAACWLLQVAACAAGTGAAPSAGKPSTFYLGGDISTLSQVERQGGIYMDGDKPGDALALFMKNGWTCFRLRIWVDPRGGIN